MLAARAMAAFTPYVPLRYAVIADTEIHRMAAVAQGTGGPLEIARRVKWDPPIGAVGDDVGAPHAVLHVPLGRLRVVVVADLGEVALLPETAVDQRYLVQCESVHGVRG